MNPINRLFTAITTPKAPPLLPLWEAIVAEARDPVWYTRHSVSDSIDGRFDMVALVTSLVMLRLEREGRVAETAQLTECFVADMDGSVRQIGIGDMIVGKHVGRMTGALGGRVGAYRAALAAASPPSMLVEALDRNLYRGDDRHGSAADMADAVIALNERIADVPLARLLEGKLR